MTGPEPVAQTETQKVPFDQKETLLHCDQEWTQVAQTSCGISILGDIGKPPGQGPGL